MQVIPVIDVQSGVAVQAIGGRRSEYRPLVSNITDSTDPVRIANSIRTCCGLSEIYLADLDAIAGAVPNLDLYRRLRADGFRLWVDAGVRDDPDIESIAESVHIVVAGSETMSSSLFSRDAESSERSARPRPRSAAPVLRVAAKRVVFSLDLRDGRPLGDWGDDLIAIVERVVNAGINRVIVLDLARVGGRQGTGTERLCTELIRRFESVQFFAGGGVRGRDDIQRLESIGLAGVLMASALHDGFGERRSVSATCPTKDTSR